MKTSTMFNRKIIICLTALIITSGFFASTLQANALTPSIVGTTGVRDTWPAYSQRSFYANGRCWVFWLNGSLSGGLEEFSSSADGVVWSNSTPINDKWVPNTRSYSIWFDGTYIHNMMAYMGEFNNLFMVYNRGLPNSDGTITWNGEQNVLSAPPQIIYDYVQISVDSNGSPWIAFETYNFTDGSSYPFVIRSSTNDGTWQTPLGFPYQLSHQNTTGIGEAAYGQGIYPLTSGKMAAVYALNNKGYIQAWDGSTWLSEVDMPMALGGEHGGTWQWSAVSQGDSLHLAFIGSNIGYLRYDYTDNSFIDATNITAPNVTAFSHICISLDPATNNLYLFWANFTGGSPPATGIAYVNRINGKWSAPLTLVTDSVASALGVSVSNIAQNGIVSIIYNEYPTYHVSFVYLNVDSLPSTQPTAVTTKNPNTSSNIVWIITVPILAVIVYIVMKTKFINSKNGNSQSGPKNIQALPYQKNVPHGDSH